MWTLFFLTLLFYISYISCEEKTSPQIVIVGAGPAGIAAASRLFQNGFQNVTILEAEDRIGGRVYSIQMGEYLIDMGGQWVHGEKDNAAFELAWPLGLLERFENSEIHMNAKLFLSSGAEISFDTSTSLLNYDFSCASDLPNDFSNLKTGSYGEYMENKFDEFFKNHSEITAEQRKPILYLMNLIEMGNHAADDWRNVSIKRLAEAPDNEGDQQINWKNRTYSTILDILMKKYPNPDQELPVARNTMLSNKVTKINYGMTDDGSKTVITQDGKKYLADHIIFTGSLGVLKADHEKIFNPSLPESKINAIKNIGMGLIGKIFLYYENPWWNDDIFMKGIVWTEADREIIESNSEKKWMLSVLGVTIVEHKPKLLSAWLSGPYVQDMEVVAEDVLFNQILELLNRIYGRAYNLTEPSMMKRTVWSTNENFRGTYSYPSLDSENANVSTDDLAEPIMNNYKLSLQFAGEATSKYYGTVHGAIRSGWREADRLINYYSLEK